jgi:hypothetical protein
MLDSLDHNSALSILAELCKDAEICKLVLALAETRLKVIDFEAITDGVFRRLNSIDVVTLWESSGKGYYGYNDPTEVAAEMLENAIESFVQEAKKRHELEMYHEEKEYCAAIVKGILRYAEEGSNEFRDWVPDDPYILADNIVYDWTIRNPGADGDVFKAELGL